MLAATEKGGGADSPAGDAQRRWLREGVRGRPMRTTFAPGPALVAPTVARTTT